MVQDRIWENDIVFSYHDFTSILTPFTNSISVVQWCLHRLTFTVKKGSFMLFFVQLLPDSLLKNSTLNFIEKIRYSIWTINYLLLGEHCEQYVRYFEDLFGQEAFATTASAWLRIVFLDETYRNLNNPIKYTYYGYEICTKVWYLNFL